MELVFFQRGVIVSLLCALLFQNLSGQFVTPGNFIPQGRVTSSPSNCNYIVTATGGTCMITTTDVERRFNLITDDLSRTKLQFIARNSILQTQLSNFSTTDKRLAIQIDAINRDLQSLKSRVQIPVNGGSTTNVNVNQLQSSLTQSINALDKRLTNLSLQRQRDAVAAAQTDSALQAQLTQVLRDNQQLRATVSTLTQDLNNFKQTYARDLQQLTTQLRVIAAATSAPGTAAPLPTSNVLPAAVLQNIQALNANIQKNTQAISGLNAQQATTKNILANHTLEVRDIHVELGTLDQRLQNVKTTADNAYNALTNFNQNVLPQVRNDISNLQNDVSGVQNTIKNLQAGQVSLLNSTVFIRSDVTNLQTDLTQGQKKQNQAIIQYAQSIVGTLGNSRQIRTQLQSLQTTLQNQLSPNAIVVPPILVSTTTPGIFVPPTLFPRPGPG